MGKALIIKVYKIVADTPNIDIDLLLKSDSSDSLAIMDNNFYYGEYRIITNKPLTIEEIAPPISYSQSISAIDKNTVYLQYGLIYLETDIKKYDKYLHDDTITDITFYDRKNPYRNESISFGFFAPNSLKEANERMSG